MEHRVQPQRGLPGILYLLLQGYQGLAGQGAFRGDICTHVPSTSIVLHVVCVPGKRACARGGGGLVWGVASGLRSRTYIDANEVVITRSAIRVLRRKLCI